MDSGGPPLRERIRTKTGLSMRQWTWAVTFALTLPYLLFIYIHLTFEINELLFAYTTLAYSLLAITLYFFL